MSELDPIVERVESEQSLEEVTPDKAGEPEVSVDESDESEEQPIDGAIEIKPGETYVPKAAVKAAKQALRAKFIPVLRDLKHKAERADQLEQAVRDAQPYIDFLKNNPNLVQPRQEPQEPQRPVNEPDPELVEIARDYDLYTQAGQFDLEKAQRIKAREERRAKQIADAAVQPYATQTYESRAVAHLQEIAGTKDADGNQLEKQYVDQTISAITANLPRERALQVLADPKVKDLLKLTALGFQAANKKAGPKAPEAAPLERESAGGGTQYVMNEHERRLARKAGMTDAEWTKSASKFKPGAYVDLE